MVQNSETATQAAGSWSRDQAWLLLPLLFAAVVYFPITRNYFYLDDFLNLYHIVNDAPLQYVLRENGGHILVARNILFYLTFAAAGPHPELFYWSAFVTHLINVGLLFLVIKRFTGRPGLASFGAALWGSSPVQEGTLGWYSVYGQAVVATTLLLVLAQAARLAQIGVPPSRGTRWLWGGLALVGAISFGTGVALATVLPLALYLLLPRSARGRWPPLLPLLVLTPLVYIGLTRIYEIDAGVSAPARSIAINIFSVLPDVPRTFARVVGAGVTHWLMGCFYPTTFGAPQWYVVLTLFALALGYALWRGSLLARRQMIACVILALACYTAIALARSLLQVEPDSMVAALTRYHYAPTIPLTMLLCFMLADRAQAVAAFVRRGLLFAWFAIAAAGQIWLGTPIDHHDSDRERTEEVLNTVQAAAAAEPPGATVRVANEQFRPFPFYAFMPGWAAAFTIFYPDDIVDGRHVVFVESNPAIIAAHGDGRRLGRLLVPPDASEAAKGAPKAAR